jgi:hypothetical protein
MLESKNTEREMMSAFDGLVHRLDTAEERPSALEDMIWKLPKLKCNEKKDFKKEQNIQEWWDN